MGKSDQKKTQTAITAETGRSQEQSGQGIGDTQARVQGLTGRSDAERNAAWGGYSDLAATGGISPDAAARLRTASTGGNAVSGGGGGGGTAPAGTNAPSYMSLYNEMMGKSGGFDPTRLSNIDAASSKLYDTSGNYGDVNDSISRLKNLDFGATDSAINKLGDWSSNYGATNKSISGLQDFAATGGVSADDLNQIRRNNFYEFENTGGYSPTDIANVRNRSNDTIKSTYGNLKDQLNRNRAVAGQVGPGWDSTAFKLARQGGIDTGKNARDTEIGIQDSVRQGKMAASQAIANNELSLLPIKSANTLGGYTNAGNLDLGRNQQMLDATMGMGNLGIDKNRALTDAYGTAGGLGISRQSNIDKATADAAGIDINAQGAINNARLSAAGGSQAEADAIRRDATSRAGIGASSSAAANALSAENERYLMGLESQNRATGLGGMLDTYKAAPSELTYNQDLLRGYRGDAASQQQGLINNRIGASYIPGIGSTIGTGIGIAGQIAGMASPIASGLQSLNKGGMQAGSMRMPTPGTPTYNPTQGYFPTYGSGFSGWA